MISPESSVLIRGNVLMFSVSFRLIALLACINGLLRG